MILFVSISTILLSLVFCFLAGKAISHVSKGKLSNLFSSFIVYVLMGALTGIATLFFHRLSPGFFGSESAFAQALYMGIIWPLIASLLVALLLGLPVFN